MNTGMEPSTPQVLSTWNHFVLKKAFLILRIGSVVLMGFCLKNAFGWPGNVIPLTFNIGYFARIHHGQLHKNNFSNGFDRNVRLNNGRSYQEHADGDQRVLTLTLLPFAAYRLYNEHQ